MQLLGEKVGLDRITKTYAQHRAIDCVSLAVPQGKFVTLLGPSGSGKTSALMAVAGFIQVDSGDIYLGDRKVTHVPAHHRNLGIVFQHYALFPHMTVAENIAYPLRMRRIARIEIRRRVGEALELIQLSALGDRFPRQLSGGQQQRVALARAVVFEPRVLLMDEPLGALDRKLREEMQIELRDFQKRLGITTLSVTHDQDEAMAMSDIIVVMKDGRVEQSGTANELYESPKTSFISSFLGLCNSFHGKIVGDIDGQCIIELGPNLTIPSPRRNDTKAEPASLIVRPERIRWTDEGQWDIRLPVTVRSATFLGDRRRYEVALPNGQAVTVIRPNVATIPTYAAGQASSIGWNVNDAIVL